MSQEFIKLIVGWLPIALLAFCFLFVMRSSRRYNTYFDKTRSMNDEILAANREALSISLEMIAELREIKQILKDQK